MDKDLPDLLPSIEEAREILMLELASYLPLLSSPLLADYNIDLRLKIYINSVILSTLMLGYSVT
jgi:hypothetical protein